MDNLGERIKNARKEKGMSQDALAELAGISRVAISHYETGKNTPLHEHLIKLSDILGSQLLDTGHEISKSVPFIGMASLGVPKGRDLSQYKKVPVDNRLYRDGMYATQAEGHIMAPKINDRNIAYCSPNEEIMDGNIVHYTYKGEGGIRRYKFNEEQHIITLLPLNPDYNVIVIDEYDSMDLKMARVVGVMDIDF